MTLYNVTLSIDIVFHIMYNEYTINIMRIILTTTARKHLSKLVNTVRYSRKPIAIGRRNKAEVLMIPFPTSFNSELDELTNFNSYGGGFDFLEDEPDLYSSTDLKKSYV